VLLTELAESPTLATFIGEGSRYLWPANYDLRRIPVTAPVPVFLSANYQCRTQEDE
jgi:hypothetical protein